MAETDGTIIIGLELDDGTIKKASVKADELANAIGKGMSDKVSSGIDKSFAGIAIQLQFVAKVAGAAFSAVGNVLSKAIEESSQAEAAFNSLQVALGNIGADPSGANAVAELAKELQNLGTVSDDAVIAASQSLVSIGNLSGPALEKATRASVDLAAGLGVDLDTAFNLVAKSAAGNAGALSKYGIKIDESLPKSEQFAAALEKINSRFGGFDEAKANTFEGALTKLSTAFNDIFESIGKFITQDKVIVAFIKFISKAFGSIAQIVDDAFGKSQGIIGDFIIKILGIAQVVNRYVGQAFDALKNIAFIAFDAIGTGLRTIFAGFTGLGFAVNKVLNAVGVVSDETLALSKKAFDDANAALVVSAKKTAETIKTELSGEIPLTDALDGLIRKAQAVAATAPEIGAAITNGIKVPIDNLGISAISVTQAFENFGIGFTEAAVEISKSAVKNFQQAGASALKGFGSAGGSAFAALGKAIAKGENAFQAFGQAFLAAIGQVAVQLGTAFILEGTAYLFSGNPALKAKAAPLIGAGAALATFGGLLAGVGGGASASGAGAGTDSGGGGGVGSPVTAEQPDLVTRNREAAVTVNVQGNILDRRESGLEIAKVLQEYFDTNDGIAVRA